MWSLSPWSWRPTERLGGVSTPLSDPGQNNRNWSPWWLMSCPGLSSRRCSSHHPLSPWSQLHQPVDVSDVWRSRCSMLPSRWRECFDNIEADQKSISGNIAHMWYKYFCLIFCLFPSSKSVNSLARLPTEQGTRWDILSFLSIYTDYCNNSDF